MQLELICLFCNSGESIVPIECWRWGSTMDTPSGDAAANGDSAGSGAGRRSGSGGGRGATPNNSGGGGAGGGSNNSMNASHAAAAAAALGLLDPSALFGNDHFSHHILGFLSFFLSLPILLLFSYVLALLIHSLGLKEQKKTIFVLFYIIILSFPSPFDLIWSDSVASISLKCVSWIGIYIFHPLGFPVTVVITVSGVDCY